MEENRIVLGIVGSPNPEGRTNQLVMAALKGAADAGATTELIQLSDYVVAACKDCLPWVCVDNLKCTYEDNAFEFLSQKILNCGALVLGTPVYWWDTSGLVKYLILKMFRVLCAFSAFAGIAGFGPFHCRRYGERPCIGTSAGLPLLPDDADAGSRTGACHSLQL